MKRREFFAVAAVMVQGAGQRPTNFGPMDENGHRPVVRPPRRDRAPSMNESTRDELERQLKCMCGGCTLNVFTCRTTDFSCPVSPAMHRDVASLVAGGYSADEILDAFSSTYGERVLMSPKREGFNWAGYVVPFVALAAGAAFVTVLLRRWTRAAPAAAIATVVPGAASASGVASADELARLREAVRNDEDDA